MKWIEFQFEHLQSWNNIIFGYSFLKNTPVIVAKTNFTRRFLLTFLWWKSQFYFVPILFIFHLWKSNFINLKVDYKKNVKIRVRRYRKGIDLLMQYHMQNEEEEMEIQVELIKLYTNLAVCYLQKGDYRRVCSTYNSAVHDCKAKVDTHAKINYV